MTNAHTTHKSKKPGWLRRARHWLSYPTSKVLPPIFGDPVPPDLKVFQAEVEEARHEIQEVLASPAVHGDRSKLAQRNRRRGLAVCDRSALTRSIESLPKC